MPTLPPQSLDAFRILIADPNEHTARQTLSLLRTMGARQVKIAGDAVAAMELLQATDFDALIIDGDIGPGGALSLVRLIRGPNNPRARAVPIVVICSRGAAGRVRSGLSAGVSAIVIRPMSARILATRIRQAAALPIVEFPGYVGPDRRRRDADYQGQDRRLTRSASDNTGDEN